MKSLTYKQANIPSFNAMEGKVSLQSGLSMIELMISITLGLLILAAMSTLFVNQSRTRTELDKAYRMIDNGRYALQVLSGELSMAGYYGEFSPSSGVPAVPTTLPNPCSTNPVNIAASLQLAIQGYNAAGATSQIASPPCGLTYTAGSNLTLKSGSDVLVIRRASNSTPITQGSALSGTHYLQVSLCEFDVEPYRVDITPANFTLRTKSCTTTSAAPYADLRNFVVQVYFVSPNNNSSPADGIPTLKRMDLDPVTHVFVTTPLVEGVDYMQVEYGLDADSDGSPDSYVDAPAITDWPAIVAVKLNVLARNTEASFGHSDTKTYFLGLAGTVGPLNDAYKRHVYAQFIRLVNPAGRREVP